MSVGLDHVQQAEEDPERHSLLLLHHSSHNSLSKAAMSSNNTSATPSFSTSNRPKRFLVGGILSSFDLSLTTSGLISHSDGLCSSVYRRAISASPSAWPYSPSSSHSTFDSSVVQEDGLPGWVCIKRVAPDEQPRPHSVDREIALLSILASHRNRKLVPLIAAIRDEEDPFGHTVDLVMPLYAATLEEVLNEPTLLPVPQVELEKPRPGASISHLWEHDAPTFITSIAKQLMEGLAFLHSNEVAHRDIKPPNLLLAPNGVLKIIDLGTAYTTTPLPSSLGQSKGSQEEEEWNGGKMVCQVGTGIFRAPELLFSPTDGYDAYAVDIWAAGVTLAHFFTSLTLLSLPTEKEEAEDRRRSWEKAFESSQSLGRSDGDVWFENERGNNGVAATMSGENEEGGKGRRSWEKACAGSDDDMWFEEDPVGNTTSNLPRSESGYIRQALFQGERGDIGLAASIFGILGLPQTVHDWPEAEYFQPPLQRMPFAATKGTGLIPALSLLQDWNRVQGGTKMQTLVESIIQPALKLSASKRPKASELLKAMQR